MAYDYQGLVNEVLSALNETTLSTSTEFNAATGFQSYVKDKVNAAVRDIYNDQLCEWPFALTTGSQVLSSGTTDYTLPAAAVSVDWDSFYIIKDAALTNGAAQELTALDYDTYRKVYRSNDKNAVSGSYTKPKFVIRKQNRDYILSGVPNAAYTINFEYFAAPTEMSVVTDTTLIPIQYKQVILDRVMWYCYMFRDNIEQSALIDKKYNDGLSVMRRLLIKQASTMRSVD